MDRNNAVKATQLGMPLGTASGRLRKKIVFHLLCRLGENVCFKCKGPIESEADLSIEHKIPWLHGDVALFWDLENIAFSHLRCNKANRPGLGLRKIGPPETSWCCDCKQFLPVDRFYVRPGRWSGLSSTCQACSAREVRERRYRAGHRVPGRSVGGQPRLASGEVCLRGHPDTPGNVYVSKGRRRCKTCLRIYKGGAI